jgi:hypothetical protein
MMSNHQDGELQRSGGRDGIFAACIGGGQGIAVLLEKSTAANGKGKH